MTYKEFDAKYNKRDKNNVVLECSIINLDGEIIFHGKLDDVERFWDDNIEVIWKKETKETLFHKVLRYEINGQEVTMTNLANYSWYRDPMLDKLHFEVR